MTEIALNDIHVNFGFKKILNGIGFEVQSGEKVALVGRNGCGKTTLFKIIAGLESCDSGLVTIRKSATIGLLEQIPNVSDLGGSDTTVKDILMSAHAHLYEIEAKMRLVEQRLSNETDEKVLNKLMNEYANLQNIFIAHDGYETEESMGKICTAFKIDESMLHRCFAELSGGQKTLIKLAKILLEKPDILLLDEPTNHLDIDSLEWLEGFIGAYRGTVVIISHDRYFLDKTVTKTVLIENGVNEVFNGNYSYCLQEQERLLMLEFESYKNQQKQIEAMKAAIKRFRDWGARADNKALFRKAANIEKRLERMELIDRPQLDKQKLPISFTLKERSGKEVVRIRDFSFSYGDNVIFNGANLDIFIKERVCLLGKNGSGKSTLIKQILAARESDEDKRSASIVVGSNVRIGYIEQEIHFENEKESILDAFKKYAVVGEGEARRILAKFFIQGDNVYKKIHSLSGGEKVILRLAFLLQDNINFFILDEPTNHIDIDTKELLEEALLSFKGTLLFISHDRYFINKIAQRVVTIEDCQIKSYDGNYDYYKQQ